MYMYVLDVLTGSASFGAYLASGLWSKAEQSSAEVWPRGQPSLKGKLFLS